MLKALNIAVIAASLSAMSTLALAQQGPGAAATDPANFAQHKQHELARIATRMQVLQTLQTCVEGASDHATIKSCNETARASLGHRM